jgi:hypothetical protein
MVNRYLSTIIAGLSIQAANGSTEAELKRTAHKWPFGISVTESRCGRSACEDIVSSLAV